MVKQFHNLLRNSAGNVSVLFAITLLPLLISAGAAIDYVSANNVHTRLQAATDAAAIAIASAGDATNAERRAIGEEYFRKGLEGTVLAQIEPDIDISEGVITVSTDYKYPTSFMALVGVKYMPMSLESQVAGGADTNAEVVMVLDYSKSMEESNKYIRMRKAAIDMVDKLVESKGSSAVKFGIVPFSAMVRTSMPASYVTQASATATWTGCTQDRPSPYNLTVATPDTANNDTKWGYIDGSGQNSGSMNCNAYKNKKVEILPLTNDADAVKSQLAAMEPIGYTNIPLGTEFGWNLLDPDEPFAEGAAYDDKKTKKFIIILTDGVQTSPQAGKDGKRSIENAQKNLVTLCDGMTEDGIVVFTIAYDVTDPAVTKLLKQCAGANYFEPDKGGAEILTVFNTITKRIRKSTLRLAR